MDSQLSILEQFAQDCLEFKSNCWLPKQRLYEVYKDWCIKNIKPVCNELTFKRRFLGMMAPYMYHNIHFILADQKRIGSERVHIYRGVGLKNAA